jgi:3,4-dihydroxy 2-butanone 4-phosphate synthase/GTP cyclohydrolase II
VRKVRVAKPGLGSVEAKVERAIEDFRRGRMVILVDDEDRENEGDLCIAAERITPEAINFMAKHGRGLICLAMTEEQIRRLQLPMMVAENTSRFGTAFTVSIEAARGVATGISARDRAITVRAAVAPNAVPGDLVQPGHVFPLRARHGGVLVRAGQTEGSVDLARLAGLSPAAVICEVMKADGSMARLPDLKRFAAAKRLQIISVADLIRFRLQRERLVHPVASAALPIEGLGDFRLFCYESEVDGRSHLALVKGRPGPGRPVLVRMHAACPTGDVFRSALCDCGPQLRLAIERIGAEQEGVVVYLQKDPADPAARVRCTHLPEVQAARKPPSDLREFGVGAQILRDLGVSKLRLLTNNPRKIVGLEGFGLTVVERVPLQTGTTARNRRYLETKRDRLGHLLEVSAAGHGGKAAAKTTGKPVRPRRRRVARVGGR